ncbi:MAG: hypothetical protein HKN76_19140, partial [Saprospiraceae bacterium]|nr:hypothetical protein [Saprospiraceae bacterium]
MKSILNYTGCLLMLFCFELHGQDTITITDADLVEGTHTWTPESVYLLDGEVTLEGGVLNVEAGTHVIASKAPGGDSTGVSGLYISAGARINAVGTIEAPIVFAGEDMVPWAGIVIAGSNGSSSGALNYVSIRWSGKSDSLNIGSALTLRNVDQLTDIHHIEVFQSAGDGIRIHGGNVNIAYAVVSFVGDDAFEYNFGWTGNGIYWYANSLNSYPWNNMADDVGSFAIEGSSFIDEDDTLISSPTIYHATLVGENCGDLSAETKGAIGFFDNAEGRLVNSAFLHFPNYGIYVEDQIGMNDSYNALQDGRLLVESNAWHDFGRAIGSAAGNKFSAGEGGLILTESMTENPSAEAVIDHLIEHFNLISPYGTIKNLAGICLAIDPRLDPANDYSNLPNAAFPANTFFNNFDAQIEKGAFSSELWIRDWTALDEMDSVIRLGEEGYGSYLFEGQTLNETDTIIISCEALPILQDSLIYVFPCRPFLYQLGAAHRKGNPRRSRPTNRSEEIDYAFIEQWEYRSGDPGCSAIAELHLTVLVLDTIAPVIHPVPDGLGGLTAITEDCDESWITDTEIDTLDNGTGTITIRYTFSAEDYSGNMSTLTVDFTQDDAASPWYADFDRDGYGNALASIMATDSVAGFVRNSDDCNDSNPFIYPRSMGPDGMSGYFYDCDSFPAEHDLCSTALLVSPGSTCEFDFGGLSLANPTIYPDLSQSCLPRNFDDVWMRTILPESGGIHLQIQEDIFALLDLTGFNRIFMAEIYSGHCQQLVLEHCMIGESSTLHYDFENADLAGQELFIRIMEVGNTSFSPFEICILDLAEKVRNDFCATAQALEVPDLDSCATFTFDNMNAIGSAGQVVSDCDSKFGARDVWFQFGAPQADSFQFVFDTITGSDFNKPIVILYKGDCSQVTELACFNYEEEG